LVPEVVTEIFPEVATVAKTPAVTTSPATIVPPVTV
jgi:hypothetical protein